MCFSLFFHVSEGIYQFESIFELVKISNNKVRTLVLSGLTPRPLFGHCQNFGGNFVFL